MRPFLFLPQRERDKRRQTRTRGTRANRSLPSPLSAPPPRVKPSTLHVQRRAAGCHGSGEQPQREGERAPSSGLCGLNARCRRGSFPCRCARRRPASAPCRSSRVKAGNSVACERERERKCSEQGRRPNRNPPLLLWSLFSSTVRRSVSALRPNRPFDPSAKNVYASQLLCAGALSLSVPPTALNKNSGRQGRQRRSFSADTCVSGSVQRLFCIISQSCSTMCIDTSYTTDPATGIGSHRRTREVSAVKGPPPHLCCLHSVSLPSPGRRTRAPVLRRSVLRQHVSASNAAVSV